MVLAPSWGFLDSHDIVKGKRLPRQSLLLYKDSKKKNTTMNNGNTILHMSIYSYIIEFEGSEKI
jgi:hypothetical protein